LVATANAINATLDEKLKFNFIRAIEPIAGLVRVPLALVVNPSFPAESLPEFIHYAKKHRERLIWRLASSGTLRMSPASCSRR
jgi:tripartite-type tricarboxylate transporter receptor subunit TctC